tara:strand:+ start:245 stop:553 length:309 start_codon:yes stop_codon:yes gene_type:complete
MSKQGHSQEQIDRKLKSIDSWKEEQVKQEKMFDTLNDTLSEIQESNLQEVVNDKLRLVSNSIQICKYQIKILESQLMVDKFRKDNYKVKMNMHSSTFNELTV